MAYKFLIIAFFVYVLPFGVLRKIYFFDNDTFKIAKILNILITLIMIWYITSPGNTIIEIFSDFNSFKANYHINSGLINADLTLICKIIHNCLNFYMIFVVFQLTRRSEKYRLIFLRLIPILFLLMSLEVNREFFKQYNNNYSGLLLAFILLWTSIKFLILFLIYKSKMFKRFMCLNDNKIKEIILKTK